MSATTLVLTELSKYGVAMAADTALTQNTPRGDARSLERRVYHGAMKLRPIPKIVAGVSVWGEGKIGTVDTDIWLRDFIGSHEPDYTDLETFARLLKDSLNTIIGVPEQEKHNAPLGFHLAGFRDTDAGRLPCFYHIHNKTKDGAFFASLDRPPQAYGEGIYCVTRNGDYHVYAELFTMIENYFTELRHRGLRLPFPEDLGMRAEYLRFQIKTIAEIYRLSNMIPWIGGPITTLTISENGFHSYETRQEIVIP